MSLKKIHDKTVPDVYENLESWSTDRRKFIKSIGVAGLLSYAGFISSCDSSNKEKQVYLSNEFLTALQAEIIQNVQLILFPNDGNGPSSEDVNAYPHFLWVLKDQYKPNSEVEYLINGIDWTEETAFEEYNKSFIELSEKEKESLVRFISETNWGGSWLSINLTLIFEALSMDPIYNVNNNNVGWDWLQHNNGEPRPNQSITYDKIFETIGAK